MILCSVDLRLPVRFPEQERNGIGERACRDQSPYATPGGLAGACRTPAPCVLTAQVRIPPPGLRQGRLFAQPRLAWASGEAGTGNLGGGRLRPKMGHGRKGTAAPPYPHAGFWGGRCSPRGRQPAPKRVIPLPQPHAASRHRVITPPAQRHAASLASRRKPSVRPQHRQASTPRRWPPLISSQGASPEGKG